MFSSGTVLFSLLTLFSFCPQGETVMQKWAYLAFELMQKVSCSYKLQVRGFGADDRHAKAFNTNLLQKGKLQ